MTTKLEVVKRADRWDWIPMVLRTVSGFNSCATVALTSVVFMVTIRDAVLASPISWFDATTIALMSMGPIVIAWHFTNARGLIEKVIRAAPVSEDEEAVRHKCEQSNLAAVEGQIYDKESHTLPRDTKVITESDVAVERELFGFSTVMLRALAGFISCHAICIGSIIYTVTIRSAVVTGKEMPGDMEVFLAIIGPIVTSWSFMRAANTISLLITGSSAIVSARKRLASIIAPTTK